MHVLSWNCRQKVVVYVDDFGVEEPTETIDPTDPEDAGVLVDL